MTGWVLFAVALVIIVILASKVRSVRATAVASVTNSGNAHVEVNGRTRAAFADFAEFCGLSGPDPIGQEPVSWTHVTHITVPTRRRINRLIREATWTRMGDQGVLMFRGELTDAEAAKIRAIVHRLW